VLWLGPGLALTKYRCEFVNLNCIIYQCSYVRRSVGLGWAMKNGPITMYEL